MKTVVFALRVGWTLVVTYFTYYLVRSGDRPASALSAFVALNALWQLFDSKKEA